MQRTGTRICLNCKEEYDAMFGGYKYCPECPDKIQYQGKSRREYNKEYYHKKRKFDEKHKEYNKQYSHNYYYKNKNICTRN